jgi:hypothetical protein
MAEEIQQSEPDEILQALVSFNDPGIIVSLFRQLGWSYTVEIQETIKLAKQNANLSIKFKAIKHLRELLKDAAETSGYIADVSSTSPNPHGGTTTFHAKRMAGFLSPAKKIESKEIKEPENDRSQRTETEHRGIDRRESLSGEIQTGIRDGACGTDTNDVFPLDPDRAGETGDPETSGSEQAQSPGGPGGTPAADGGPPPECGNSGGGPGSLPDSPISGPETSSEGTGYRPADGENPCIKTRPPTCDRQLYPGVSQGEDRG